MGIILILLFHFDHFDSACKKPLLNLNEMEFGHIRFSQK